MNPPFFVSETKNGGFTTSYRESEEIDRLLKTLNVQGMRENALSKAIKSRRDDMLAVRGVVFERVVFERSVRA